MNKKNKPLFWKKERNKWMWLLIWGVLQLADYHTNLPVRYVQRMKMAPGDELGEVSLSFATCRPVTDDNSSTAGIETAHTHRGRLTLKSPVKSQRAPSISTCIWQWGDADGLPGSADLIYGGKKYLCAESDLKIKKYQRSLDRKVPRNVPFVWVHN